MNIFYDYFHQSLASGNIKLLDDDIRAVLLSPSYVFNRGHRRIDDIRNGFVEGAEIITVQNNPILSGKGFIPSPITGQPTVFDADDVAFATLSADSEAQYVVLYDQTAEGASRDSLICIMEFDSIKVPNATGTLFLSWSELGLFDIGVGDNTGGFEHSHANKIYLGYIDQPLSKVSSPIFGSITANDFVRTNGIGGVGSNVLKLISDLDTNNFKINGITNIADNDLVIHKTGDETVSGIKTFSNIKITEIPIADSDAINIEYIKNIFNSYTGTKEDTFWLNWKQIPDNNSLKIIGANQIISFKDKDNQDIFISAAGSANANTIIGGRYNGTHTGIIGITANNGLLASKEKHTIGYNINADKWQIGNGYDWSDLADADHTHNKLQISDFLESDYVHTKPIDPYIPEHVAGLKVFRQLRVYREYPIWISGTNYTKESTPKIWSYNKVTGSYTLYDLVTDHISSGESLTDPAEINNWLLSTDQEEARHIAFENGTEGSMFAIGMNTKDESWIEAYNGALHATVFQKHIVSNFGKLYRFPFEEDSFTYEKNALIYDNATRRLYKSLESVVIAAGEKRSKMNPASPDYDANYTFYLYDETKFAPIKFAYEYSPTIKYFMNDIVMVSSTGPLNKSTMYICIDDNDGNGITGVAVTDGSKWHSYGAIGGDWVRSSALDTTNQRSYEVPADMDRQAYIYKYAGASSLTITNIMDAGGIQWSWERVKASFDQGENPTPWWNPNTVYSVGQYVCYLISDGIGGFVDDIGIYKVLTAHTSSSAESTNNDNFNVDLTANRIVKIPSLDTVIRKANANTLSSPITIAIGDEYAHIHYGEKYAGQYVYSINTSVQTRMFFDDEEASKWILSANPHMQNILVDEPTHVIISKCDSALTFIIDETVFEGLTLNIKNVNQQVSVYPRNKTSRIDDFYDMQSPLNVDMYDNITLLCSEKQMYIM